MFSNAGQDEAEKVRESARPYVEEGVRVPCEFIFIFLVFSFLETEKGGCVSDDGLRSYSIHMCWEISEEDEEEDYVSFSFKTPAEDHRVKREENRS
jgi:hypothetical protein